MGKESLREKEKRMSDDAKFIAEKHNLLVNCVRKHPVLSLWIILILLLVLGLLIFLRIRDFPIFGHGFGLVPTDCQDDPYISESIFSLANEGKGWEAGSNYTIKWYLKPKKDFYGHLILYLKPALSTGLISPPVFLEHDDISFEGNQSKEIVGKVATLSISKGWYNICGTIKDNKEGVAFIKTYCDSRQISVS